MAELVEEGPLQRPERGSGLGEDPSVEVVPVCFLDGALVRQNCSPAAQGICSGAEGVTARVWAAL